MPKLTLKIYFLIKVWENMLNFMFKYYVFVLITYLYFVGVKDFYIVYKETYWQFNLRVLHELTFKSQFKREPLLKFLI